MFSSSSWATELVAELGVGWLTTMLGVRGGWSGFRGDRIDGRWAESDGGGDFNRSGVTPASGPIPFGPLLALERVASPMHSWEGGDWTVGALVTDSARWMAAAEGTLGLDARFEPKSWLFFRDRLSREAGGPMGLDDARMGDASRDRSGEAEADVEVGRGVVAARRRMWDGETDRYAPSMEDLAEVLSGSGGGRATPFFFVARPSAASSEDAIALVGLRTCDVGGFRGAHALGSHSSEERKDGRCRRRGPRAVGRCAREGCGWGRYC
jgi:hypothetical protein